MKREFAQQLDAEALALFARKGFEGGPGVPQAGEANGVKVRRVIQITRDLAPRPFGALRILDLGCGDGVYAIEASVQGAHVVALDARTQRMDLGAACAARHGLKSVRFAQEDVRRVTREAYGEFDVVDLLGLLYHLDVPEVFSVLEGIHTFSFRFTRESLVRVLHDVGFTSVFECFVPFEPHKSEDRITLVAVKGIPVSLSTYPWMNHKSEAGIERTLRPAGQAGP